MTWSNLLAHSLWIGGLALGLAALGVASYRAETERSGLGQELATPGFWAAVFVAEILVSLGMFFSISTWWLRSLAAVWTLLTAGWALVVHGPGLGVAARRRWSSAAQDTRWPSRRNQLLGRALLAAGLLVIAGWILVTAIQTLGHARSLQAHVQQLESLAQARPTSLAAPELERLGSHIAGMHDDLAAIDAAVGPLLPVGQLLVWVPTYGGDLAAAADLLDLGLHTAAAGDRTFQALSPALEVLDAPHGDSASAQSLGEQLLPILVAAGSELQMARQDLALAGQSRGRIDPGDLSSRTAGLVERLDRYLPWFETAVDGALLAPGLLGADGSRTYLAVAQNNHELRASGGFISGVGELQVEEGRIVSVDFRDSYAVDNFQVPHDDAPPDLQATLFGQMWLFRDANWSADFPTSARQMLALYAQDQGVMADGVITLDLTALELLLAAIGPLKIEGISQPVTGENVQQTIQEQWENPTAGPGIEDEETREWWQHRKDFMGEIAAAVLVKLQGGQEVKLGALAGALEQALREKHILLYLHDAQALDLLRDRNWDGAVPVVGPPSDFLMVVDSNVGFNKVDPNVSRSILYQVELGQGDSPRARVTLTYRNQSRRSVDVCIQEARYGDSYADMMERCYWDYVRLYAPPGSRLLAGPDLPLPPGSLFARNSGTAADLPAAQDLENDASVWNAFFDLPPGQERILTFEYELPADVLEQTTDGLVRYRLRIQKQPGTEAVPLEVRIFLPVDAELVRSLPSGFAFRRQQDTSSEGALLLLSTDLQIDRRLEVIFRAGQSQK